MKVKEIFNAAKQRTDYCYKKIKNSMDDTIDKIKSFPKEHPFATTTLSFLSILTIKLAFDNTDKDKQIDSLELQNTEKQNECEDLKSKLSSANLELENTNKEKEEMQKKYTDLWVKTVSISGVGLKAGSSEAGKILNEEQQRQKSQFLS